ncbi:MAG: penicillin-binding protein activator [Sulfuricella sp.]|nr:penicillin-binding protein activator [Sulfuricella sp.]
MQRFLAFLVILFAVFDAGCAATATSAPVSEINLASPSRQSAPAGTAQPTPAPLRAQPEQPTAKTSPLVSAPPPIAMPIPRDKSGTPHIALLLPLDSASFGPAAEAVKQGFFAASIMQAPAVPRLQVYPTGDRAEDIVSAYGQALQAGANVVVGPLTRNAVTALAKSGTVAVPTLALNYPENDTPLPENLYLFGLSAEGEAVQAAQLAFADGRRSALTVAANTPLAKRVEQAFAGAWRSLGGTLAAQAGFSPDQTQFPALQEAVSGHPADMIFLAADASRARLVRPYLDASKPIYATSMVFDGNREISRNVDLNGVVFVEMPWLILPDHPAVMIYPRSENLGIEQQRLYALGIDAFRLAALMAQNLPVEGAVLDGVTGRIALEGRQFQRQMTVAQFRQGMAVAVESAGPDAHGESPSRIMKSDSP